MNVLGLFSGIGGFELGLERAGMHIAAMCEIDPFCRRVLRKHWPDAELFNDARTLEYHGTVDVIVSGDPCQRDSRANASRDGESMWPHTFRQIRRHRPLFVLRENVLGNIDTGTLERVEGDLAGAGYAVRTYDIPASAVGAAHDRPRTWTLAHADRAGRQERHHASQPGSPQGWQHSMHVGPHGLYWLGSEPPVLRRADDVPNRVDRIGRLGNAVIPVIAEIFGRAIMTTSHIR